MMKKSLLSKLAAALAFSGVYRLRGKRRKQNGRKRNIGNDERRRYPKSGG